MSRPSTFFILNLRKDVDGRNKSGHDDGEVRLRRDDEMQSTRDIRLSTHAFAAANA
jgi:hypothetical protein